MVYKLISAKRIIAKILTDLDIQEENIRVTDLLEWIGEGLVKIGGFPQFNIRTTGKEDLPILVINNYQAELPFDFHSLIQVAYSSVSKGPFFPMRQATGSFEHNSDPVEVVTTSVEEVPVTSDIITLAMHLYNETYQQAVARINSQPSIRSVLAALLENSNSSSLRQGSVTDDYVYTIRGGYIKTNQPTGYLMVAYQAIPTDLEGYPLVPDNEAYLEALYWYCVMKLYYPKWVAGTVRDAVYYDARRSWSFFRKQAYGEAMMPDKGQLESIKNTWNRLIPNVNEFDTAMSHLGQEQIVYTHSQE